MGRHVGAFIAEQSLRAVNIISERLQKENYGLFVVAQLWPPAPALPKHQCPKILVTVNIVKTVKCHTDGHEGGAQFKTNYEAKSSENGAEAEMQMRWSKVQTELSAAKKPNSLSSSSSCLVMVHVSSMLSV